MKTHTIKLTEEQNDHLKIAAEKENITVNQYLLRLVTKTVLNVE